MPVTGEFLPPTHEPDQFHPYTEIMSSSNAHTEIMAISAITKTKSVPCSYKKQINFNPHTKTRSILTPAQKSVNFGPPTKTKSSYVPTPKQVNLDPNTDIKAISIPILKTTQFRMPPTRKPSLFRSRL